jgi:hypothetical protein
MAEIRNDTPGVTKYSDHEVIVTPNRLKKAVRRAGADERDPIVDAEAALVELSAQFGSWMEDECAELDKARQVLHAEGFTEAARQRLFRAAHDIKGHGATFGFPIAAEVADSLCQLIEHGADLSPAAHHHRSVRRCGARHHPRARPRQCRAHRRRIGGEPPHARGRPPRRPER